MMDKLKMHTPDLVNANIERIAELFPTCVTETCEEVDGVKHYKRAIDFDLLRQELSDRIVEGPQERYRLDWPGKRESLLAANAPIAKTLRPCREESVNFDTTQNLFIEGDNLDALKLLQETYLGKVKMIYIDPPYNTGNDFIYNDDFAESTQDYLQHSNQGDDEGRLVANPETDGQFHSKWLAMIYARLQLARNLLRDDGAIFISIDDNEVGNLRKACEEVFGEGNFVGQIVWQRSKKGDAKLVAKIHEYILCYVRNKESVLANGPWRRQKEGADDVLEKYATLRRELQGDHEAIRVEMMTWYKELPNKDPRKAHKHYNWSDDRGLYFADNFAGPDDGRKSRPRHDILHPATGKPCKKPSTGWRWDEKKTKWALEQDPPRIHFGSDETTIPNRKSYLAEISSEPFSSLFYRDGRSATLEVEDLVGKGWFPFPKNTDVLAELIELVTAPDDVILDFFAGSGSTGHAIMNVNLKHGSKRRSVLVQLPEPTGKEHYATIAEISKERIRRAGAKIKADHAGKQGIDELDVGFRVLKIDTSNMAEVYYKPDELKQDDLLGQVDNVKPDRTAEDLLFQVLLDWGVDLSLPIVRETIYPQISPMTADVEPKKNLRESAQSADRKGLEVFFVDGNALAACFVADGSVDEAFVTELAKRKPVRVVFRDKGFASDNARINVEQIFKTLSPDTEVRTV